MFQELRIRASGNMSFTSFLTKIHSHQGQANYWCADQIFNHSFLQDSSPMKLSLSSGKYQEGKRIILFDFEFHDH